MTQKLSYQASELNSLDRDTEEILSKLSDKIYSLEIQSPYKILNKIKSFIKRNSLAITKKSNGKPTIHFCCNCLKAYIIKIAKENNLGKNITNSLTIVLNCSLGHDGYYLDADKLMKIT